MRSVNRDDIYIITVLFAASAGIAYIYDLFMGTMYFGTNMMWLSGFKAMRDSVKNSNGGEK